MLLLKSLLLALCRLLSFGAWALARVLRVREVRGKEKKEKVAGVEGEDPILGGGGGRYRKRRRRRLRANFLPDAPSSE